MNTNTMLRRRRVLRAVGLGGLTVAGTGVASARGHDRNFRAHLSGDDEVPPVETKARGQTVFRLGEAGDQLRYKLIVANLEDVFMAHVHSAPAGSNGSVVAWLYPAGGPPSRQIDGRFDGVLAESTLTADDLVGPLSGGSMADLVALLRSGNAYVNVHTVAHPGGEVRGQVR